MLAVLRHTGRAGAKEFIAPRSAIPTDDADLRVRTSDSGSEIGKNVENMRIIVFYLVGTMVA